MFEKDENFMPIILNVIMDNSFSLFHHIGCTEKEI
jgi:hypothetical protein